MTYSTLNYKEKYMENKVEKQAKFIELRAKGNSYDNIVKQLGVSKNTLLKWSKELATEIEDAVIFEKDALMERHKRRFT